ncbi:phage protease [Campylobacter sp.]|uniref:phage protease n=1 Tax=Campylobacter sp. TaxID=205 RepID=UPI00258EC896|nr:phage protease [Campylobacter sp.]MCI6641980.1 phage protease [Campylobacter sp.]
MQKGVIEKLLSLNYKDGELIKVSPVGEVKGLDGRVFKINAASLIETIQKNNLDIVLDENHSFAGAIGWFGKDSFVEKEDGIYAKLELNDKGKELVEKRIYRYLSPVFDTDGSEVTGLDSVGLVNRPNLLNNALNFKGEEMNVKDSSEYKELLKELEKIKKENEALKNELEKLKKDSTQEKNEKAENESDKKELNTRLENIESSLKSITAIFGKKNLEANEKESLSEAEKNIANMLGISEDEYKGAK